MAQVLQFPANKKPGRETDEQADATPNVRGLIQISSTEDGDVISVTGAYADRLQHGAFVTLKLLNIFADRIAESGTAGYSSVPPLNEQITQRSELPPGLADTNFGELVG